MKTITKFIYSTFAVVSLAITALTANADAGDIFVSDYANGRIYKFAPDGTGSIFASGFNGPVGLAFDSSGYLFATGFTNGWIYKVAPDGTWTVFTTGLANPTGLAFDATGNLFAGDWSGGTIYQFDTAATRTTFKTGLHPWGLAFDTAGNLFEADLDTGAIYKFTTGGTQSTFTVGLNSPVGLAFDSAGYLFAGDYNSGGTIHKFDPVGTGTTFTTGVSVPQGLAFDSDGYLFVASYDSGNIYKIAPDGTRTIFGTVAGNPVFVAIRPTPPISYVAQIQQPINANESSVFNVRRGVVPVKFTLTMNGVATCDLPEATIAVTRTAGSVIGPVDESIYTGHADTGSNFRIDSCQYIYNLSANALGVGTYRVDILINDHVVGSASFALR